MIRLFSLVFLALTLCGCKKKSVRLTVRVHNPTADVVELSGLNFKKSFIIDSNGEGWVEFDAVPMTYKFLNGSDSTDIFLRNGYNLHMNYVNGKIEKTLKFSGDGEKVNVAMQKIIRNNKDLRVKLDMYKDEPSKAVQYIEMHFERNKLISENSGLDKMEQRALIPKIMKGT